MDNAVLASRETLPDNFKAAYAVAKLAARLKYSLLLSSQDGKKLCFSELRPSFALSNGVN
jgi:hypothetical protein